MKTTATCLLLATVLFSISAKAQCGFTITPNVTDASGCGTPDGAIEWIIDGGTAPYLYSGPFGTPPPLNNLVSGTYEVFIMDSTGCLDSAVAVVGPSPLQIELGVDSSNYGSWEVTVNITGGTSPFAYAWSDGNTAAAIVHPASFFTGYFSVTVSDVNGCSAAANTVADSSPCGVMYTGAYDSVANEFTLMFNAQTPIAFPAAGSIYNWDFGDGNTSTDQFPTHSYATNGIYNVCLEVSLNSGGLACSYCRLIGIDSLGNAVLRQDAEGFVMNVVPFGVTSVGTGSAPSFTMYPNPAADETVLSWFASKPEVCRVELRNALGQRLQTFDASLNVGENRVRLSLENFASGTYFVTVSTASGTESRMLVK